MPESLDSIISSLLAPLERSPLLTNPPKLPTETKSAHSFHGGSAAAHDRVHHLLSSGAATSYKDTRNGLLGLDFSTKLSAWLALGCITARQIHHALLEFEEINTKAPRVTERAKTKARLRSDSNYFGGIT